MAEVRQTGMALAIEMVQDKTSKTASPRGSSAVAWRCTSIALSRGALLRPLGSVVYFLPPYVISPEQIDFLAEVASGGIGIATRDSLSVAVQADLYPNHRDRADGMEHSFWHDRWATNQDRLHQPATHSWSLTAPPSPCPARARPAAAMRQDPSISPGCWPPRPGRGRRAERTGGAAAVRRAGATPCIQVLNDALQRYGDGQPDGLRRRYLRPQPRRWAR